MKMCAIVTNLKSVFFVFFCVYFCMLVLIGTILLIQNTRTPRGLSPEAKSQNFHLLWANMEVRLEIPRNCAIYLGKIIICRTR